MGEKTIKFESDTAGTLTVEAYDGDGLGTKTLLTFSDTTSEVRQTSYASQHMRLKFDTAATVDAVVSLEPRV